MTAKYSVPEIDRMLAALRDTRVGLAYVDEVTGSFWPKTRTPKRSELAQVRLTLAEWLRVKDAAKRERKTVSGWLRDMIADRFCGGAE